MLYRNASLFVLPSIHEGLPIAALEAANLDTPVLLSDVPANRDIDLPQQCYFPVGNVAALRRKLEAPHQTYRVDRRAIAQRFDWLAVARQTQALYAELFPPPAPRTRMQIR